MKYYGIKRVGGKGYENNYLVVRKRRKRESAFFLFLLLFGGVIYLVATVIFRSMTLTEIPVSLPVLF